MIKKRKDIDLGTVSTALRQALITAIWSQEEAEGHVPTTVGLQLLTVEYRVSYRSPLPASASPSTEKTFDPVNDMGPEEASVSQADGADSGGPFGC